MGPRGRAGYSDLVTLPVSATSTRMLDDLVEAIRGRVIGGLRVHDAHAELKPGAEGDTVVRLTVLVDDPPAGAPTWPLDAADAIEHEAQRIAWDLGIVEWVYLVFVPLSEVATSSFAARHR